MTNVIYLVRYSNSYGGEERCPQAYTRSDLALREAEDSDGVVQVIILHKEAD